jgi:hypothetical protein
VGELSAAGYLLQATVWEIGQLVIQDDIGKTGFDKSFLLDLL